MIKPLPIDYQRMHESLGRPTTVHEDVTRNRHEVETGSRQAFRMEALGWWDLVRTTEFIDGARSIYCVNGAGKAALAEWMDQRPPIRPGDQRGISVEGRHFFASRCRNSSGWSIAEVDQADPNGCRDIAIVAQRIHTRQLSSALDAILRTNT
jgi:hypothetical protein